MVHKNLERRLKELETGGRIELKNFCFSDSSEKLESVQEAETQKLLSDFEMQMNPQILARRSDLVSINKKILAV